MWRLLATLLFISWIGRSSALLKGCNVTFTQLNFSVEYVMCPEGCWQRNPDICGNVLYGESGSVCRAAIHSGAAAGTGGIVKVYKAGMAAPSGRMSHGMSSKNCSMQQTYSFSMTCDTPGDSQFNINTVNCPSNCAGTSTKVCGSQIYSGSSAVCKAAIYAGKTTAAGGKVVFYRVTKQPSYASSTPQNGVTISNSCPASDFAFTFEPKRDICLNNVQCLNGASCMDGVNTFHCFCAPGFEGKYCQNNTDDCVISPCQNNGTCVDKVNSYKCDCTYGYNDTNCTNFIGQCVDSPCQHGNCSHGTKTDYNCTCDPGWEGKNCSIDINECLSDPCKNSGTCTDKVNGYTCSCVLGYMGADCGNETIECSHNLCKNGGTCVDLVADYSCTCPNGFTGRNCEKVPDYCLNNDCVETATCSPDTATGGHTCNCLPGYHGDGKTLCTLSCVQADVGNYTFNETLVGQTALSQQKCTDGRSIASSSCEQTTNPNVATADFTAPIVVPCAATAASVLTNVTTTGSAANVTSKQVDVTIAKLFTVTSNSTNVTQADSSRTLQVLDYYTKATVKIPASTLYNTIAVVSVISGTLTSQNDTSQQTKATETAKLRNVIRSFSKKVTLPPNQHSLTLTTKDTELQISIPKNITVGGVTTFQPVTFQSEAKGKSVPVNATIPGSVFEGLPKNVRISFVLFYDKNLYPTKQHVTDIIMITLGNFTNLPNKKDVITSFNVSKSNPDGQIISKDSTKRNFTIHYCTIWNEKLAEFERIRSASIGAKECPSNMLGSFSTLFRSEVLPSAGALTIFTYIGLGISTVGLLITFCVYVCVPELRSRQPTLYLANTCVALLAVNLTFLFGVTNVGHTSLCYFNTVVLHYFLLVAWCWMAANGLNMYRVLVKVLGASSPSTGKYAALFSYGVPFIIVAFSAGVTIFYMDPRDQQPGILPDERNELFYVSGYKASNICWLAVGKHVFNFAFLLPMVLLALTNAVFCTTITVHLTCKRRTVQSTKADRTTSQDLIVVVTLVLMMGLTWVFGFLMLFSENVYYIEIMAWLFTIFNSLQGLSMFIMNCLRQPNIRKLWLHPLLKKISCGKYDQLGSRVNNLSSSNPQYLSTTTSTLPRKKS